jgi:rubredoxin
MGNPDASGTRDELGRNGTVPNSKRGSDVAQHLRALGEQPGSYVTFFSSGDVVKGEFHCSACGYGVTVYRVLPVCPMCAGTAWEQVPWSPLTRSLEHGESRLPLSPS